MQSIIFLSTLIFLSIPIITIWIKWLWKRRKFYILSMQLPGPFTIPLLGSIVAAMKIMLSKNPENVFWQYHQKYSRLHAIWLGLDLYLFAMEPEDIESLSCSAVSGKSIEFQRFWKSAMGSGLVTKDGVEGGKDSWKEHKKIMYPSLSSGANKFYYETLRKNCIFFSQDLEKLCDKGLVDIELPVLRFCGDVTTECLLSTSINFRNEKNDQMFHAIKDILACVVPQAIKAWLRINTIFYMSEMGKKQLEATKILRKFSEKVFEDMLLSSDQNETLHNSLESNTIALLMKAYHQKKIDKNHVIEEIMNVFPAGSTAGVEIKFAILCLAMYKECQQKAFEEIKEYYKGDRNAEIQFDDMKSFPYLEMCVKESLRLFGAGPITSRYVTEDFVFKNGNLMIPKGAVFIVSSYLTHRNPKQWKDPEEYLPERFTPEENSKRHPYSYIPFGVGPRRCAGRSLSDMMTSACLVHLLREYEFHSDWEAKNIPLELGINVSSLWGYKVCITKREW